MVGSTHFAARAAALNAATLALLDAGSVGMRGVAVAVALAGVEGGLVLDPSGVEEGKARSRYVFGWGFGKGLGMEGEEGVKMEVDGDDAVRTNDAELVWAEGEGEFTKEEVS
jgi:exosome complex component RRP46